MKQTNIKLLRTVKFWALRVLEVPVWVTLIALYVMGTTLRALSLLLCGEARMARNEFTWITNKRH